MYQFLRGGSINWALFSGIRVFCLFVCFRCSRQPPTNESAWHSNTRPISANSSLLCNLKSGPRVRSLGGWEKHSVSTNKTKSQDKSNAETTLNQKGLASCARMLICYEQINWPVTVSPTKGHTLSWCLRFGWNNTFLSSDIKPGEDSKSGAPKVSSYPEAFNAPYSCWASHAYLISNMNLSLFTLNKLSNLEGQYDPVYRTQLTTMTMVSRSATARGLRYPFLCKNHTLLVYISAGWTCCFCAKFKHAQLCIDISTI